MSWVQVPSLAPSLLAESDLPASSCVEPVEGFAMRLQGKIAIVVGAGQSPGEGIGNGRATALRFAQEGARVMAVDRVLASAEETAALARQDGVDFEADVTKEATLKAMIDAAHKQWGKIDCLHYNVGVSIAGGDASPLDI